MWLDWALPKGGVIGVEEELTSQADIKRTSSLAHFLGHPLFKDTCYSCVGAYDRHMLTGLGALYGSCLLLDLSLPHFSPTRHCLDDEAV